MVSSFPSSSLSCRVSEMRSFKVRLRLTTGMYSSSLSETFTTLFCIAERPLLLTGDGLRLTTAGVLERDMLWSDGDGHLPISDEVNDDVDEDGTA